MGTLNFLLNPAPEGGLLGGGMCNEVSIVPSRSRHGGWIWGIRHDGVSPALRAGLARTLNDAIQRCCECTGANRWTASLEDRLHVVGRAGHREPVAILEQALANRTNGGEALMLTPGRVPPRLSA